MGEGIETAVMGRVLRSFCLFKYSIKGLENNVRHKHGRTLALCVHAVPGSLLMHVSEGVRDAPGRSTGGRLQVWRDGAKDQGNGGGSGGVARACHEAPGHL